MLERLEHSFARERRFTADVAHELRTPLHAVATQCEYALSRPEREEKDEALRKILQKNGEMTALIGQLLMLARVESGQMPQEDACSLSEMVAEIAQDMEPVAAEKGMRIQTQLCSFTMKGNRALLGARIHQFGGQCDSLWPGRRHPAGSPCGAARKASAFALKTMGAALHSRISR